MSTVHGDIGVSIGLSEEDLLRGQARFNQALNEMAATAEKLGAVLDRVMAQIGADTQEAAKATRELTEEEKAAAAEAKAAEEAEKKAHQAAAAEAKKHKEALSNLRERLGQVAAAAGVTAAALGLVAKSATDAYNQQNSAYQGLDATAERMVGDVAAVRKAMQELTADAMMTEAEVSRAMQAGLQTNFSVEQTVNLIKAFKDSAAFNRQAGLEFGEAVVRAMEGVKMGNSVLSDAAGITKNLSVILREAGKSEQDLQNVMSDASVRQALYNGILREAAIYQGNAAKAADSLAGSQARASTETFRAKAALGESLAPAVQAVSDVTAQLAVKVAELIRANPELARTLLLVAGGMAAVVTVVGSLTVAFLTLNMAIGPVGWVTLGLSALVGALGGLAISGAAAKREADQHAQSVANLGIQYERLNATIESNTASAADKERAQQDLKRVIQEIGDLMPEIVTKWDAEGHAIEINTQKLKENTEATRENIRAKAQNDLMAAADDEAKARDALTSFLNDKAIRRRNYIAEKIHFLGPSVELDSQQRAKYEKIFGDEFDAQFAAQEKKLRDALAAAEAKTNRLAAQAAGPDERGRGSYVSNPGKQPITYDSGTGIGGTSSGGQRDPFQDAMAWVDHLKAMDQLTVEQEIAMLEEIKARYAKTKEDEWQIDERIHNLRKQSADKEKADAEEARKAKLNAAMNLLDHEIRMGQISTADEVKRLQDILATYQLTAEERQALEERLAAAQTRLANEVAAEWKKTEDAAKQAVEDRVRSEVAAINHQKQMGQLSRDQEIAALKAHLETEKAYYQLHADERWAIEERLFQLEDQARQESLAKEQEAMQRAIQQEQSWIQQLAQADIEALRQRNQAAEAAQQARIQGLQDQLNALERIWAAEDRQRNLADLQQQRADIIANTMGKFKKIVNGVEVDTYDEAAVRELDKRIADQQREDARAQQREALQDQIKAAQDQLAAMRTQHQNAEAERQKFWQNIQNLDISKLGDLSEAVGKGLDTWIGVFKSKLDELKREIEARAAAIQSALESIYSLPSPTLPETPTLPATLAASVTPTINANPQVSIVVHGATDPQVTAAAVQTAAAQGTEQGIIGAIVQAGRQRLATTTA